MKYTTPSLIAGVGLCISAIAVPSYAEIKIGIAGPLSGATLNVGEQQEIGANSAISTINEAGGVLGEQVVVTSVDDACEPEQAIAAAQQLVSEGVVFVVGHACSGASIAAGEIYEKAGIIMMSPTSTNPKVTELGRKHVFRVIGRDDQQGVIAGDHLADQFADKKIALLHDGRAYGLGLVNFTKERLNQRGITETMLDTYKPEQDDYNGTVEKMVAAGIEVVYAAGYQGDIAIMLRQAKEQIPDLQLLSGDALVNAEFLVIAGEAGQGARFTFGPDIRLNPAASDAVTSIRDNDGYEPDGYTLYAYGAVQAWAQAATKANSVEAKKVIEKLKDGTYNTVLGKIGFDDKGDVTGVSSFVWYEFGETDFKLLK